MPPPPQKVSSPQPKWWSPKSALLLVLGFAVIAGFPYLTSVSRLLAEGRPVTLGSITEEARKEGIKKETEHERHAPKKQREIKALTVMADGTVYAGGWAGVLCWKNETWEKVPGFEDPEARSLSSAPDGSLLIGGKHGAYRLTSDGFTCLYEGDVHSVSQSADGTLYVSGPKTGLKKRAPQGDWQVVSEGFPSVEAP